MQTIFKFEPLLGLDEDQKKFQQDMLELDGYKNINNSRSWCIICEDIRIEDLAKHIADMFPLLTFIGYGQYPNCMNYGFRFIFNSHDCRLYLSEDHDGFSIRSTDGVFPKDLPPEKVRCYPDWIVREYPEKKEDGIIERTKGHDNNSASYWL